MSATAPAAAAGTGRPRRQVLGLLPGVVLLLGGAVLIAHDATWSDWVGMAVGVVGLVAVALPVTYGGGRGIAVFVAGVAVAMGGVGLVHGGWLPTAGREDDATVTASRLACVDAHGCRYVDRLTLRASDGTAIPGHLDLDTLSGVHVGDTVDVRWDPTGLVANPRTATDTSPVTFVGGAVTVLAALIALAFLASTSKPEPFVPRSQRPDSSPEGIRRRLAAEAQFEADTTAATTQQHATFSDRHQAGLGSAAPNARGELGGQLPNGVDPGRAGVVEHPPHEG